MSNSKQVLYALECSHAAPGPATLVSGALTCAWCLGPRVIVGVIEYEWASVCRRCTFVRYAGLSKHNAEIMARGHSQKPGGHSVALEYRRNPTAVETARKFLAWRGRETA